jgi:hypothetical protein
MRDWDEKRAALEHDCPECGQPPGRRCRKPTRDWLDRSTIYNYVNPHPERVQVAWRAYLKEAD